LTDVLIAGGGPSGLAAAIALAERGVSVTIADPAGGIAARRGEVMPQAAAAILDRLGLGDVLMSALPIEDVASRWGAAGLQAHGRSPGLALHGWGIDRRELSRLMLRRLATSGIHLREARVSAHRRTAEGWQVRLTSPGGTAIARARYLIDATGRPARIARRQGATLLQGPDLVALVWRTATTHPARLLCEAVPGGWWYSVPQPGGGTLGFMTGADRAKELSRAPEAFLASSRGSLRLIVVAASLAPPRLMIGRSALLDRMCGPGWLATGDAAAAFDPIASQGLFNALSGGFFAGHAAADAVAGDGEAPRIYETLAVRTADRTHAMTRLQYAAMPYDTPFWRRRALRAAEEIGAASELKRPPPETGPGDTKKAAREPPFRSKSMVFP
jgi:2-polyprenyl-6-methoxyphenol hydroxylase-like FAD-dependent oxidoreductase